MVDVDSVEWFTLIFFKSDWVVFEIAIKKGTLRPLARISRVSAVTVKHVVMLFIRICVSVGWVAILMCRAQLISVFYAAYPWEYSPPLAAVHLWISQAQSRSWCPQHHFQIHQYMHHTLRKKIGANTDGNIQICCKVVQPHLNHRGLRRHLDGDGSMDLKVGGNLWSMAQWIYASIGCCPSRDSYTDVSPASRSVTSRMSFTPREADSDTGHIKNGIRWLSLVA
jgi:hypothetical protein